MAQSQNHNLLGERKTHAVVAKRNFVELELKVSDEGDQNTSNLDVSKLRDPEFPTKILYLPRKTHVFANATMPPSAERLIHALGSFADEPITVVRLLSSQIVLEGPSSLTVRINPAVWVPLRMILPDFPIDLSKCWGSDGSVTLWYDILAVFRRGGKGTRDNDVGDDHALC